MGYNYTNGDGPSVLLTSEPDGATEPVSILDNAIRQIKSYLNDPTAGPAALIAALIPTGLIVPGWPTTSAPTGWLICDGSAVSRTTYAALFAVIGTVFGAGNGSTTFNVPDLRDKFIKGKSSDAIGDTGGSATHTLTQAELPTFSSIIEFVTPGAGALDIPTGGTENANSASMGGNAPHNNLPPYLVLNAIIKT